MSGTELAQLAEEAAAEVPDAVADTDGTTTLWSVSGKPFVVLSGDTLEFRLDPVLGAAARRTPDTGASARGDDWVAFRPKELDAYGADRVMAWFGAAHRRASG